MIKIRYIWPGNYHHRVNISLKVYNFVPENDFTQLVDREDMYDIIADRANWKYCRIEWDPKFNTKTYQSVWVSSLWTNIPSSKIKDEIEIKHDWLTPVVVNDIDKALAELWVSTEEEDQSTLDDLLDIIEDLPEWNLPDDYIDEIVNDQLDTEAEIATDLDIKPVEKSKKKEKKEKWKHKWNKIVVDVSSDVDPKSLVK